ncbi:MAG TPA: hypothetical protein VL381_09965 [Rhodocyclaceae bacterium]|jgi:hypothetical protein|nr:hypothetical protein [Rhodocyclaceae bacterium]
MHKRLTHLLLAFLLLCAQALAGAHAVEHAVAQDKDLPPHVCELCLAAHDLGSGLTSSTFVAPSINASYVLATHCLIGRAALPAPQARQQGPPTL